MLHKASTAMERLAFIFAIHHDRKELKKAITRYGKYCSQAVRDDIIKEILNTPDYEEKYNQLAEWYESFKPLAEQFASEGFPGMVVLDNGEAYPVQINLRNAELRMQIFPGLTEQEAEIQIKADRHWAVGNEYEIQLGMGHGVMRSLNSHRMFFKVMLFEAKGFSGTIADLGVEDIANKQYRPDVNVRSVAGGRV